MQTPPRLKERVTSAWNDYWFGISGFYGLAISRLVVGASLLLCYLDYRKDWAAYLTSQPAGLYQPKGLLQLLGSTPPPAAFFQIAEAAGVIALVLFVIGLRARAAGIVAVVAHLAMASLTFSFQRWVEHGYNPIFLAFLALLAGDHSRSFSADWFLAKTGSPKPKASAAGQTLALWAITLAFFAAAYWKWRSSPDLAWAFSDNLRHQIIMRFLWTGESIPAFPAWIASEPWRYHLAALGNLALQVAPIGACFALRRPWIRAALGAVVITELVLLDHVMALPEPRWFPLIALFVDWDALLHRAPRFAKLAPASSPEKSAWATGWIAAFLFCYFSIALVDPALNVRLNAYPFANFRLFAELRVKKPTDAHLPYEFLAARFEAKTSNPEQASKLSRLTRKSARDYRNVYIETSGKRLAEYVDQFRLEALGIGVRGLNEVRLYKVVLQAPAYPAGVTLNEIRRGLAARWDSAGGFRYVDARLAMDANGHSCFDFVQVGYDERPAKVELMKDLGSPEPVALSGSWLESRFCTPDPLPARFSLLAHMPAEGDTYLIAPLEKRNLFKAPLVTAADSTPHAR